MYAKGGDSYGILVRKDANITKPEDLRGKKVAVPQGTAPAQGLNQVVRRAGLPADSVKRVNATYGNMGQMLVQGKPVQLRTPLEARHHGIAMVFQETSLVPSMTVAQNLYLNREIRSSWAPLGRLGWLDKKAMRAEFWGGKDRAVN